ncbi:TPA: LexA family protein [Enterobacter hormaechei]
MPVAAGLGAHQPNRRLRLAAEPQTGRREVSALTDARKTLAYDFFRILRAPLDRAEEPRHGSIVIASIDNEFTVKQLQLRPYPCLMPLNPAFPPIRFDPEALQIWGVVTFTVMRHRPCTP